MSHDSNWTGFTKSTLKPVQFESWLKLKLNWHYNCCTHDICGLTAIPRIFHISHIRQQTQISPYTDTHSRLLSRNWNSRGLYKTCSWKTCLSKTCSKRRVHAGRITRSFTFFSILFQRSLANVNFSFCDFCPVQFVWKFMRIFNILWTFMTIISFFDIQYF